MTSEIAEAIRLERKLADRGVADNVHLPTPGLVKAIGNTPLLRLHKVKPSIEPQASLYGKAEFLNPGGSVKDRPAWAMIEEGLRSGALDRNKILIDATSGNTGIAYAMIATALGIPVRLAIPENASRPRKHLLESYGAELVFTDPAEGTDGARDLVRNLVSQEPEKYFYPDQYGNDANWLAHFRTTGEEILEQTGGNVDYFVAALGTTGTFTGTVRRLKLKNPNLVAVVVQPDTALHAIEGIKHMPSADVPAIFDETLVDEVVEVSTEEAKEMAARLTREEGLFVGPSAGANVAGSLKLVDRGARGNIVTVLCDSGARYIE